MRHRHRKGRLKVTAAHHRAMRRNLVASLFEYGQVVTTVAKAKSFRPFAEKLITLARRGNARKAEGTPEGKAAHLHAIRRAAQLMPPATPPTTTIRRVVSARASWSGAGDVAAVLMLRSYDTPGGIQTPG